MKRTGTANLTELIVVLSIVLILASAMVPRFLLSRDRATRENAFQSFKALSNALLMYRTEFSQFPINGSITAPLGSYTDVTRIKGDFTQVAITTYGSATCVEAQVANMMELTPYWMVYCPDCASDLYCSTDSKSTWFSCQKGLSETGSTLSCP